MLFQEDARHRQDVAKAIEDEIAIAQCRGRKLAVILTHSGDFSHTIADASREVANGRRAPSAIRARFRARVDHLVDYRTEYFEARARQITGGPAVELILRRHRPGFAEELPWLLAPTGRLEMFKVSSAAKTGKMFRMLSPLASAAGLQFNPLSLMNANKGIVDVNLGIWDVRPSAARHWV